MIQQEEGRSEERIGLNAPARWALAPLIGFDRRRHAIISLIRLFLTMPPLRVLPPWCRRTAPAPANGRHDGTRSDMRDRSSNEWIQGMNEMESRRNWGAEEALTKVTVGGHDGDTIASI